MVTAQRIAHTLKGLAGSIGASSLAGESAFLEASFANNDLESTRSLAKICFAGLARVQEQLREAFTMDDEAEAPVTGSRPPELTDEQKARKKELLDRLVAYLREDDAEASAFFSNYANELKPLLDGNLFLGLQGCISRFEFEEALACLLKHGEIEAKPDA